MSSGMTHPDLAVYRLTKGGESGLNLGLGDLFDREIEIPSFRELISFLLGKQKLRIKIKAFPRVMIERLENIQMGVDEQIQREIIKAKQRSM